MEKKLEVEVNLFVEVKFRSYNQESNKENRSDANITKGDKTSGSEGLLVD